MLERAVGLSLENIHYIILQTLSFFKKRKLQGMNTKTVSTVPL